MISPFVGRIFDWYVKNTDQKEFEPADDPGRDDNIKMISINDWLELTNLFVQKYQPRKVNNYITRPQMFKRWIKLSTE